MVGNVLVVFATGWYGDLALPTAFSGVYSNLNSAASAQGILVGARVVQTGDGTTWSGFGGGNGGNVFGIFELSGAHAIQASAALGSPSGPNWPFFAGSAANSYTFFVLENDSTNGYSSISGASLLFNGTNTAANHPAVVATIPTGSVANAVVVYTGSTFGAALFATVSVTQ